MSNDNKEITYNAFGYKPQYCTIENVHSRKEIECEKSHLFPSITEPDQSLSIEEILQRGLTGQSLTGENGYYGIDEEMASIDRMDKLERIDFARQNRKRVDALRMQMQKEAEEEEARKQEAVFQEKVDAEIKLRQAKETNKE